MTERDAPYPVRPFPREYKMRKLMWFAVGFLLACVVACYVLTGVFLYLFTVCAILGTIGCGFAHSPFGRRVFTAMLGLTVGLIWLAGFQMLYLHTAMAQDGKQIPLSIAVSEYGTEMDTYTSGKGSIRLNGRKYHVRFYLDGNATLKPGDSVDGEFRMRYTFEGGSNPSSYQPGEGTFLIAYGEGEPVVTAGENVPWYYFPAVLNRLAGDQVDKCFPEDTAGFARALLLGDSRKLEYSDDMALRTSGIRHVIAVSGLHVSILFSLLYLVTRKRPLITALLGLPMLILFAAFTGFSPSVVRACTMQGLMLLAALCRRDYDSLTALSFSVLCMLAVNPVVVTSVSFQLSVACTAGILLIAPKLKTYFSRWIHGKQGTVSGAVARWITGTMAVSISAALVTLPLCAVHFGSISLLGVLTNLLTLWMIPVLFCGIILSLLLGAAFPPLGSALAWLLSWGIRYVMLVARGIAAIPFASFFTTNIYSILWLVFFFLMLAVFLLSKKKRPGLFLACLLAGLAVSIVLHQTEPGMDAFRLAVLDVGQGQCVILQTEDKCYIVDCGGDSAKGAADSAYRYIRSFGIREVDGLIITHYDTDHVGGARYLMESIPVETLYLPDTADNRNYKETLQASYSDRITWVTDVARLPLNDDTNMTIIPSAEGTTSNESGLCILFSSGDCDILITGDRNISGEEELLRTGLIPDIEILVVGHHGSDSSTGLPLLSETKPEVAIISVGENNSYGHPNAQTLRRLKLFGCSVLRTDRDHTVEFRGR